MPTCLGFADHSLDWNEILTLLLVPSFASRAMVKLLSNAEVHYIK